MPVKPVGAFLFWFCLLSITCKTEFWWQGPSPWGYSTSEGRSTALDLGKEQPLLQRYGAKGLLILILICFADQIPGIKRWEGKDWKQCCDHGIQPQTMKKTQSV